MLTQIWVNIGSGNVSLPASIKPLSEPVLVHHQMCSMTFTWEQSYRCSCISWIGCNRSSQIAFLTHLPLVQQYVSVKWLSVGSDNGSAPNRRQAITWTNAGLLLIRHLGTNFNEIRIEIQNFSLMKMHLKMSSAKLEAILSRGRWVKDNITSPRDRWFNPFAGHPSKTSMNDLTYWDLSIHQVMAGCMFGTKSKPEPILI